MDQPRVPPGVDATVPNVARMYDYYLSGKDNFAADRKAAEDVLSIAPEARFMARENRGFVRRVVRFLTGEAGIRQIIDIGTGLPTQGNVHEVAGAFTRVTYVDNDPVVMVHAKALMDDRPEVSILEGDLRSPESILEHPGLNADLDEPVAVLMTAILHFVRDEEGPYDIVREFRDAMAPGSYLALSHSTSDSGPDAAARIAEIYERASAPGVLRPRAEIGRFFEGLDLLDPGLVYTPMWRPDAARDLPDPAKAWMLAGVGRKD